MDTRRPREINHSTNAAMPKDPANSAIDRRWPVGQPASRAARATKPPAKMAGTPITMMNSTGREAGPAYGKIPEVWLSNER